jgi:hypothetical protein
MTANAQVGTNGRRTAATEGNAHALSDRPVRTNFTLSLCELSELANMRAVIRDHLRAAEVPPERVADALLVASELATNARGAARAGSPIEVAGWVREGRIGLAVRNNHQDDHPRTGLFTPVRMPSPDAERGRGLATVAALACRLSADIDADHTTVHAELTV